jgi:rhomboid protease GluP
LANPWIILEPKNGPFANRQTINLNWITAGFILQFVIFWFTLYIPKVNGTALNGIPAPTPAKEDVPVSELLTPRKGYFATPLLLYVNLVVYVLMMITTGDVVQFETRDLIRWGANDSFKTTTGEWWRLVTSGFIHASIYHLIFNAVGLVVAGLFTETVISTRRFVLIYFLSIIAASLTSTWCHQETVSVGASGGIFGLYGLLVALLITKSIKSRSWLLLLSFVIAYIGIQLLIGLLPGIDNAAHVGGLICGFVIGLIASRIKQAPRNSADRRAS